MSAALERGPVRKLVDLEAWRYFEGFLPGKLGRLVFYGAIAAAQSLLLLPILLLVRYSVDHAIPRREFGLLVAIGGGIFALRALNGAVTLWLRSKYIHEIKQAILRLREDLLLRLYALPRAAYTQLDLDTTHARIVLDTDRLDNMSQAVVSRIIPASFSALALVVLLGFLNWRLLVVTLTLAPLVLVAVRITGSRVKDRVYAFQRAFEAFSNGMLFVLQHMDLTQVQSSQAREIERRTQDMRRLRDTSESMAFLYSVHSQLQGIVVTFVGVVILVVGGAAVAARSMTIGEFLSFWVAAGLLNGHVSTIVAAIPECIAGNESMVTLHRFASAEAPRPYHGRERIAFTGAIELEDVTFGYRAAPVLRQVNLEIRPGETFAIAGANGAGKSTLLYLILGFYRPERGAVRADGVPYDRLDLVELRRSIGVVMQHPTFFAGSVRDNITYGSPEASADDMTRASRLALADEFIRRLPQGYDTQIGEEGVLLSGGEVQRIAIARALLGKPKLLILDEPTNHLERSMVRTLIDNLRSLEERPAIIVISHDREVLREAESFYRVENGTVLPYATLPALEAAPRGIAAS